VAKSVEAFRVAQIAADAKAFDALCAAELSYSHSDGRVEDKATFIANANLLGLERKPSYMIPIDDGATATAKIATWWRERWLRNRIRCDEVLLELERHTLVRPIRHGGRAVVPPPADQPLLFADLG